MMYSEFVKGTNCKETDFNYNVFLNLEQVYMNSDLTKEEIYAIGKMRVDNSETETERRTRLAIEATVADFEETIRSNVAQAASHKQAADDCKVYIAHCLENGDKELAESWKWHYKTERRMMNYHLDAAKTARAQLRAYKHFMGL